MAVKHRAKGHGRSLMVQDVSLRSWAAGFVYSKFITEYSSFWAEQVKIVFILKCKVPGNISLITSLG